MKKNINPRLFKFKVSNEYGWGISAEVESIDEVSAISAWIKEVRVKRKSFTFTYEKRFNTWRVEYYIPSRTKSPDKVAGYLTLKINKI